MKSRDDRPERHDDQANAAREADAGTPAGSKWAKKFAWLATGCTAIALAVGGGWSTTLFGVVADAGAAGDHVNDALGRPALGVTVIELRGQLPTMALGTSPRGADRSVLLGGQTEEGQLLGLVWRHEGAVVGKAVVRVELTGGRKAVRIVGARPIVKRVGKPLTAVLLACETQGEEGTVEMVARLDPLSPAFLGAPPSSRPYFETRTISLKRDEQQTLDMTVIPGRGVYDFTILIDYAYDGRTETREVFDADGRPFRVTSAVPPGTYGTVYVPAGGSRGYRALRAPEVAARFARGARGPGC
ncbi:hypothetical protein ABZ815_29460 [Nonomuraea sp. NPDC047529]|uniref:hypothetical protein n=1 Tax=Nonomuraea sp. NPDC047529 TaxID=3155623 RepID=UPI00340D804C